MEHSTYLSSLFVVLRLLLHLFSLCFGDVRLQLFYWLAYGWNITIYTYIYRYLHMYRFTYIYIYIYSLGELTFKPSSCIYTLSSTMFEKSRPINHHFTIHGTHALQYPPQMSTYTFIRNLLLFFHYIYIFLSSICIDHIIHIL